MNSLDADSQPNLLPCDGRVWLATSLFDEASSRLYFEELQQVVPWQSDRIKMFGKEIITSRKMSWYGDDSFEYKYSGTAHRALPWTESLRTIKNEVESVAGYSFNSCLLNLYHNGDEGMGWHSDNEKVLGQNPTIASVSFGASRKFRLRHRESGEKVEVWLENGDALFMEGATQHHWQHALPKTKKVHDPRINLTFRKFLGA